MTEKTSVWDLFNNSAELIETDQNNRAKLVTNDQNFDYKKWNYLAKDTFAPSAEKFIKFKSKSNFFSNQHIICKLEAPTEDGQSRITEYTNLIH